ncbi:MAG: hypothetical protein A2W98_13315 [Bacteroidetes bacterium GWF2_33_38]|nr:MAG: hypothetical protein A2W98_13315 [Bacteroidetes bacterium GWF2_33_38]OFY70066.1 MAG: hypothetical protein A2265_07110 [Bacteroidetes bacterium RIFOXYA12_FULL_33_9]OFY91820.1 MAG: hypothetical protein A2236_02945 [Bacteroidetes bacterium RIFOXYA2_FULL_33_7]
MKSNKKINVFIVDDNKVFSMALSADIENTFPKMSIEIHTFETGESCMNTFKDIKPQIVILDYHLNSKFTDAADGIKVLDWLKKENPETYVIMLTGDDNINIALKSFQHGASDYIVKTDTKLRKLVFSLFNFFKIMEAKKAAKRYQNMVIGLLFGISFLIGVVVAIQIFEPAFFN